MAVEMDHTPQEIGITFFSDYDLLEIENEIGGEDDHGKPCHAKIIQKPGDYPYGCRMPGLGTGTAGRDFDVPRGGRQG